MLLCDNCPDPESCAYYQKSAGCWYVLEALEGEELSKFVQKEVFEG